MADPGHHSRLTDPDAWYLKPEISMDAKEAVEARTSTHGDYSLSSNYIQLRKQMMRHTPEWDALTGDQKQTLDMIAVKEARILFGDPHERDHWVDIEGYAKLVTDRMAHGKG